MRSALLFLLTVLLASSAQAINWTKRVYNVPGQGIERADFTGDGYPDLLLYDIGGITIIPNLGTNQGKFNPAAAFTLETAASTVATGRPVVLDFNRDGNLDVARCSENGVVIFLGSGNGTLSLAQTIPGACSWVATADFNKDGNADLAVGQSAGPHTTDHNQVIVYFGDGAGGISSQVVNDNVNFTSSNQDPCNLSGAGIAADFTGDRVPDIAITSNCLSDVASTALLVIGVGDGTGHFTFHKDQEMGFEASMKLRLVDADQNGTQDIYASAGGSGPHASSGSDLILFRGHGDGTFAPFKSVVEDNPGSGPRVVGPGLILDVDGDSFMDVIAIVGLQDQEQTTTTYQMQFYKGQPDGSFKLTGTSPLATGAFDMVWGDFDIDGRVDLAMARLQPNTTDVWINTTDTAPRCGAGTQRTIASCTLFPAVPGNVHFIVNPFDTRIVDAIQIYVDGVLKFETHDNVFNKTLQLAPGEHRVRVKAWDEVGPFSSVRSVTPKTPCLNTVNRTVKICTPHNGAEIVNTSGVVRIIAKAATDKPFNAIQVYVDGKLIFQDTSTLLVRDFLLVASPSATHRVTVKGWDNAGAFSSSITVTTTHEDIQQ